MFCRLCCWIWWSRKFSYRRTSDIQWISCTFYFKNVRSIVSSAPNCYLTVMNWYDILLLNKSAHIEVGLVIMTFRSKCHVWLLKRSKLKDHVTFPMARHDILHVNKPVHIEVGLVIAFIMIFRSKFLVCLLKCFNNTERSCNFRDTFAKCAKNIRQNCRGIQFNSVFFEGIRYNKKIISVSRH